MKIPIHVRRGWEKGYVLAYCPNLVGCSAAGQSEEEAVGLVRRRIEEYFESERKRPAPPGTRKLELEL